MKRHPVAKLLVIAGMFLLIGILIFNGLKPVSQHAKPIQPLEANKAAAIPIRESLVPSVIVPIQRQDPLLQSLGRNWHAQLSELHGIGKLFGIGGEERMKRLQDYTESLDTMDVPIAVKELQDLQATNPTETGRDLRLRLLQRWGGVDARGAADLAARMPPGAERLEAIATVAGVWAGQSFADANTWSAQLSDVDERQSALENVADAAVYKTPLNALKLASTLAPSAERDSVITRAIGGWARKSPEDAVAWAKQVPDEGLRERAIANIAMSWSEQNPVAAGNLAVNSLPAGQLQDRAVMVIVQRWSMTDISGAKSWVGQFPEGSLRETATLTLNNFSTDGRPSRLPGSQ